MVLLHRCAAQTIRFVENIHRPRDFKQPESCVKHHRNMHVPLLLEFTAYARRAFRRVRAVEAVRRLAFFRHDESVLGLPPRINVERDV
jgi:hypothetical protein